MDNNDIKQKKKRGEKRKRNGLKVFAVLLVLMVLFAALALYGCRQLVELKAMASDIKKDAYGLVNNFSCGKTESTLQYLDRLEQDMSGLEEKLNSPVYRAAGLIPGIGNDLNAAREMTALFSEVSDELIRPTVEFLDSNPLAGLTTDSGINSAAADSLLEFCERLAPSLERITREVGSINLSVVDPSGEINGYLELVGKLSDIISEASAAVIEPLRAQLALCPLDDLKTSDGFNMNSVNSYLDFLESFVPGCRGIAEKLSALELGDLDRKGTVAGYSAALSEIVDLYDNNHEYIDLARALIGDGDRLYLIAAQDTSETYALGGFPGSMGTLTIENGRLSVGTFSGVHDFFAGGYAYDNQPTAEELSCFGAMYALAWDAGYCPDFTRVGKLWAGCFDWRNGTKIDGCIALCPAVVGKLLNIVGPIVLSNGDTVTGDNALAYISFDVHLKYLNDGRTVRQGNEIADEVYSEIARKAMEKLVKEFRISDLPKYVELMRSGFEDRTIMLWFRDDNDELTAKAAGCDGALGHDAAEPEIGLFFSTISACKMGWWMDIGYELSEPTINADGSRSYTLTAEFAIDMTKAESRNYSYYIATIDNGYIQTQWSIIGPEGGSISDVQTSSHYKQQTFQGLDIVQYSPDMGPENSVIVTCTVTTAPGVEKTPRIITNPTLTQCRAEYYSAAGWDTILPSVGSGNK